MKYSIFSEAFSEMLSSRFYFSERFTETMHKEI